MQIFLYEFVTSGGMSGCQSIPRSLLQEGRGMVDALATDFAAAGFEVQRMIDTSVCPSPNNRSAEQMYHTVNSSADERPLFIELAQASDATMVIAPETDNALSERVRWTLEAGGQLLGPDLRVTELATDKHQLAEHLSACGIPVVEGIALAAGSRLPADVPYPAVIKPRDGAGSQQMYLLKQLNPSLHTPVAARLEPYLEGLPISVSILAGPGGICPLPACRQLLSDDGKFTYLGGSLPLDPHHAERGTRLAVRAAAACGTLRGFLGVDLILGSNVDEDRVIEINPRLTTSYLLLRRATEENLASAIVRWSLYRSAPPVFSDRKTQFLLSQWAEAIA